MVPPRLTLVPPIPDPNARNDDAGEASGQAAATGLSGNVSALPFADHREKLRILEALLFAAAEPLDERKLKSHLAEDEDIFALLDEL